MLSTVWTFALHSFFSLQQALRSKTFFTRGVARSDFESLRRFPTAAHGIWVCLPGQCGRSPTLRSWRSPWVSRYLSTKLFWRKVHRYCAIAPLKANVVQHLLLCGIAIVSIVIPRYPGRLPTHYPFAQLIRSVQAQASAFYLRNIRHARQRSSEPGSDTIKSLSSTHFCHDNLLFFIVQYITLVYSALHDSSSCSVFRSLSLNLSQAILLLVYHSLSLSAIFKLFKFLFIPVHHSPLRFGANVCRRERRYYWPTDLELSTLYYTYFLPCQDFSVKLIFLFLHCF